MGIHLFLCGFPLHRCEQPLEQGTILNMGDPAGPMAAWACFRGRGDKDEWRIHIWAHLGPKGITKPGHLPRCTLRYTQEPAFLEAWQKERSCFSSSDRWGRGEVQRRQGIHLRLSPCADYRGTLLGPNSAAEQGLGFGTELFMLALPN